ncbi:MAG: PIG-L family deacetylase [Dehalococcoidia bacterium]|nr:PIG-L family deacetylase [Dehalococcoidia bacterium]
MPGALVLTAHGDDMEFFAGGTIALLCERGWDVDVLIATDNSRGTFELSTEQMFGLRLKEADAAAQVLGVRSVSCLDYPDGFLCETPHTTLRGQFMDAIRRHRPGIVFTWDPWAPYENHPDHRAVSWAAMEAASFAHFPLYYPEQLAGGLEPYYVPEVWYFAKNPVDVNKRVALSDAAIQKKIDALCCYDSQMVLTLRDHQIAIESAPYDVPRITGLDPHDYRAYIDHTVRRGALRAGREAGMEYAEQFRRTRWGGTERQAPDGTIPPDPV